MRNPKLLLPLGIAVLGFIAGVFSITSRPVEELRPGLEPAGAGMKNTSMPNGASASDPVAAILGELGEPDYLKRVAALGKWMDQMGTPEMQDLLERLRRSHSASDRQLMPAVLAYWASRDPAAATDWLRPYLNDPSRLPGALFSSRLPNFEECITSWAQAAPKQALELASASPHSDWCKYILNRAIRALKAPPTERLRILAALPEDEQRYFRTQEILSEWARDNPHAALAAAKALSPGKERDAAIAAVLKKQFSKDPAAALLQAGALDVQNLPVLGGLLVNVANTDPATALRWLETRDPNFETTLPHALLIGWTAQDPVAALQWALQQDLQYETENSGSREPLLGREQLQRAFGKDKAATFAWLNRLPPGEKREQLMELAVYTIPNAADAIPLLSQLSGETAAGVARNIASRMVDNDPVQTEQWASSLPPGAMRTAAWEGIGRERSEPLPIPPGPDRDAMLSGMAFQIEGRTEPHKFADWVLEIGDPVVRQRAFEDAMTFWVEMSSMTGSGPAIREWLQNASIPADWKKKWFERLRP